MFTILLIKIDYIEYIDDTIYRIEFCTVNVDNISDEQGSITIIHCRYD